MNSLSALLSHAYIAYTIEFDNEFERRFSKLWLVSMAMYFNCMRFVDERGIGVEDLLQSALTPTNFKGMVRWGYVTVKDKTVFATEKGLQAKRCFEETFPVVDARWRERFGNDAVERLRETLVEVCVSLGRALPDTMPIVGHGFMLRGRVRESGVSDPSGTELTKLALPSLLAKPLIAIGVLFERQAHVSLGLSANILAAIDDRARVADLPHRSGVSKAAVAMAMTFLKNGGFANVETIDRRRTASLTDKGGQAKSRHMSLLAVAERDVARRCLRNEAERLQTALDAIVGSATFMDGVTSRPANWRAGAPPIERLPDFPLLLHRGAFPDGS